LKLKISFLCNRWLLAALGYVLMAWAGQSLWHYGILNTGMAVLSGVLVVPVVLLIGSLFEDFTLGRVACLAALAWALNECWYYSDTTFLTASWVLLRFVVGFLLALSPVWVRVFTWIIQESMKKKKVEEEQARRRQAIHIRFMIDRLRPTYLEVLRLQAGASSGELESAFRRRSKETHPDLNRDDPEAAGKFDEVKKAYDFLKEHGTAASIKRRVRPTRVRVRYARRRG